MVQEANRYGRLVIERKEPILLLNVFFLSSLFPILYTILSPSNSQVAMAVSTNVDEATEAEDG